jgi:hypothetical protein
MATMRREGGDNVPVSLKSRRTRERVLALTAALSFVGLLLGAPPFRAAAVKHTTRALSGPPSTGAAIAMDGGVADTACYYTGR